jgi:hypothetical protein
MAAVSTVRRIETDISAFEGAKLPPGPIAIICAGLLGVAASTSALYAFADSSKVRAAVTLAVAAAAFVALAALLRQNKRVAVYNENVIEQNTQKLGPVLLSEVGVKMPAGVPAEFARMMILPSPASQTPACVFLADGHEVTVRLGEVVVGALPNLVADVRPRATD